MLVKSVNISYTLANIQIFDKKPLRWEHFFSNILTFVCMETLHEFKQSILIVYR